MGNGPECASIHFMRIQTAPGRASPSAKNSNKYQFALPRAVGVKRAYNLNNLRA